MTYSLPRLPHTRVTLVALLTLLASACAGRVPEESGAMLYRRNCAPCHGESGRGDGPVAANLCPPPPDLTRLTSGIPDLLRQIDGRRTIRSHGTAAMPVWGEVFEQSQIGEPHARRTALLRAQAIAEHAYRLRGK